MPEHAKSHSKERTQRKKSVPFRACRLSTSEQPNISAQFYPEWVKNRSIQPRPEIPMLHRSPRVNPY